MLVPVLSSCFSPPAEANDERFWPQWRGPLATGEGIGAKPPIEWDAESGKNVRWKTALPGKGHSTPVVWGERVFVTAAIPIGEPLKEPKWSERPGAHDNLPITHRQQFVVMALSRKNGEVLWQKSVHEALPHEGGHESGTLASASPVTDGERVFAFFGSRGLYCLDGESGDLIWKTDLGEMHTKHGHGEGSSPVLHDGILAVNWDHEGESFVVAYDAETGKERWRQKRNEVTSWATPIVVEHGGKRQLIVPGTEKLRAYDLGSGEVIWECGGLSNNIVASPVAADGIVVVGSSYEKQAMLAIRLEGARGDLTGTQNVLWRRIRRTPYVPSPLLFEGSLYFFGHYQPILVRVDLKTGEETAGPFRLDGMQSLYASPVAADGRVYITDLAGQTLVLSADAEPQMLAANGLGESVSASAALAGKELFLRGERHLFCISEEAE